MTAPDHYLALRVPSFLASGREAEGTHQHSSRTHGTDRRRSTPRLNFSFQTDGNEMTKCGSCDRMRAQHSSTHRLTRSTSVYALNTGLRVQELNSVRTQHPGLRLQLGLKLGIDVGDICLLQHRADEVHIQMRHHDWGGIPCARLAPRYAARYAMLAPRAPLGLM